MTVNYSNKNVCNVYSIQYPQMLNVAPVQLICLADYLYQQE